MIFKQGKKSLNVHEDNVFREDQYQSWFTKFSSGNLDIENVPRSRKSVNTDEVTSTAIN